RARGAGIDQIGVTATDGWRGRYVDARKAIPIHAEDRPRERQTPLQQREFAADLVAVQIVRIDIAGRFDGDVRSVQQAVIVEIAHIYDSASSRTWRRTAQAKALRPAGINER